MPNWTINNVHFSGPAEAIDQIYRAFTSDSPFQTLYPCPQELIDTVAGFLGDTERQAELEKQRASNEEKYGYQDWYDWCCANWGTKWDATDVSVTSERLFLQASDCCFSVRFETAWSPPEDFLVHISNVLGVEINGDYSLEEEGHDIHYSYQVTPGGLQIYDTEDLSEPDEDWQEPDDPYESPDDSPIDPSFRAVTGSATKLPLP